MPGQPQLSDDDRIIAKILWLAAVDPEAKRIVVEEAKRILLELESRSHPAIPKLSSIVIKQADGFKYQYTG